MASALPDSTLPHPMPLQPSVPVPIPPHCSFLIFLFFLFICLSQFLFRVCLFYEKSPKLGDLALILILVSPWYDLD